MTDAMDQPATKRELYEVRDVIRRELHDEIGVVRRELYEVRDELKRDIAASSRDIAERPTYSQMRALFEDFEGRMRVMFDPYRDLPARTARLETAVFGPNGSGASAPRKRPPAKRRKRAA